MNITENMLPIAADLLLKDDRTVATCLTGTEWQMPSLPLHRSRRCADSALAKRPDGVKKPEILPPTFTRVINTAGFLSRGQVQECEILLALALSSRGAEIVDGEHIVHEERLGQDLERMEADTGFRLRLRA